jgi:hypothetical protein
MFFIEFTAYIFIAYAIYKILKRKMAKPKYTDKTVWITGASSGIG